MPAKLKIPAPIDRPLSRAYLRQFTGWSSQFPPDLSDPSSLRIMENVMTNRDGSVRIRPGLRYASFVRGAVPTPAPEPMKALDVAMVGTHEPFFLNDGSKAYLFAARETDGTVGFRVLARVNGLSTVYPIDHPAIGFVIDQGYDTLVFTADTTYVKYLQIDNKIFALSNAGESFRYFTVGAVKTAKTLAPILRPLWDPDDKLTVVEPNASWILFEDPTYTRFNRIVSPAMVGIKGWVAGNHTKMTQLQAPHHDGTHCVSLESIPERTNLMVQPLHTVQPIEIDMWTPGVGVNDISIVDNALRVHALPGAKSRPIFVQAPRCPSVNQFVKYQVAFTVTEAALSMNGAIRFRWFTSADAPIGPLIERDYPMETGRHVIAMRAPKGAATLQVMIGGHSTATNPEAYSIANVLVGNAVEPSTIFSGYSGADYFWSGTPGHSRSFYQPVTTVNMHTKVTPRLYEDPTDWIASLYTMAATVARPCRVDIVWRDKNDKTIEVASGADLPDAVGTWTRPFSTDTIPAKATYAIVWIQIQNVPRGETHYVDSALFEQGTSLDTWFCGATPDTDGVDNEWLGEPHFSISKQSVTAADRGIPAPETPTTKTLISSDADKNTFSFGFFYTFSNEIGESAASQVAIVKTQRAWSAWVWERPNSAGEPSGTPATHPGLCADQLVGIIPKDVFSAAVDQGAISWTMYVFTWPADQSVPVMAVAADEVLIDADTHAYSQDGWGRIFPQLPDAGDVVVVPTLANRFNYSAPGAPAQGLVAADRLIMVADSTNPARIRWTSNLQGHYTDFSAHRGGGYKTLTSGNLFLPASVRLWQNPQSVDTLTIMCLGVDGYSTSYYMQPAQIASQTEATNIMGFEETTATPGTTSPYGAEVLNNALFHPLDEMLMKSTANNYNIAHKSLTDMIQNSWISLQTKQRIVSCQHDNRLYYLVNNPLGEMVPDGCMGNEVWVYDTGLGSDKGTWSRWLTPGCSLRKIEQGNRVYMSLAHPDGLFYFDEYYGSDDVVDPTTKLVSARAIPWRLETNTQGANRAHDAWCHLQQMNLHVGNFLGTMRYGIHSWDVNGKQVDISKVVRDLNPVDDQAPFDLEDFLLIRRELRDWRFFAESVLDDDGVTVLPSVGQISLVQYRYTPISINVGYEYGSVETFEYGRTPGLPTLSTLQDVTNGVPVPYIDTRRP